MVIISATEGPLFCTTSFIFIVCGTVAYTIFDEKTDKSRSPAPITGSLRALLISSPTPLKEQRRSQAHLFAFFGMSLVYLTANQEGRNWGSDSNWQSGKFYLSMRVLPTGPIFVVFTAWFFAFSLDRLRKLRSTVISVLSRIMMLFVSVSLIPIMESACSVLVCGEFACPPDHVLNPYGALLPNETMKCDYCPACSNLLQYQTLRLAADPSIPCEDGRLPGSTRWAAGLLTFSVFASMMGIMWLLRQTASSIEAKIILTKRMKGTLNPEHGAAHIDDETWSEAIAATKPPTAVFLNVFTYRSRYWYVVLLAYKLYIVLVTKLLGPRQKWGSLGLALFGHLGMLISGVMVHTYIDRRMRIIANLSAAVNVINVVFALAVAISLELGGTSQSAGYNFCSVTVILANCVVGVVCVALFVFPKVCGLKCCVDVPNETETTKTPVSTFSSPPPAKYFPPSDEPSASLVSVNEDEINSEVRSTGKRAARRSTYGTESLMVAVGDASPSSNGDDDDTVSRRSSTLSAVRGLSQILPFVLVILAATRRRNGRYRFEE